MTDPKISIVTLSFNQRAYLQQAMDSLLQQGYSNIEYIVVDPGSTDGSRELIQSYKDRIAHALLEPDRGAADGLNKGFALATGDVLGFLNADDLLLEGSLRRVADFFQAHPECDLVFGNGFIVDGAGNPTRHIKARGFTVPRYLYGGARWLQQSVFFRRKAFLGSPGFNPANRTCWDGELFVNMANLGATVGYIDADLSAFRIYSASISGSGSNRNAYLGDCRRVFRELRGRGWNWMDEVVRFQYRVEGLLVRCAQWLHKQVRKRNS